MKFLFILITGLLCLSAWADETVRFPTLGDDVSGDSIVRFNNGGGSVYIFANYEEPSGDGDTAASSAKAYIPVDNGNSQRDRVSFAQTSSVPDLTSGTFQTYLKVLNNTGSDRKLYVAVQDPDDTADYCVVGGGSTFSSSTSEVLSWIQVDLVNICSYTTCTSINAGTTKTKDYQFYFFLTSTVIGTGTCDGFNSSELGGVYLKGDLSVRLPTSTLVINQLRRGDGRLKSVFTGTTISDFNRTLALINGTGADITSGGDSAIQLNVPGTELIDLETSSTSTEANIKPLVNGVRYSVGMVIEDKYKLTTKISNVFSETPAQIEALLEKQACYVLSAGFGEKHFITDYFRGLRDKVLLKTTLGSSFVEWYYRTAPYYTATIYNSPMLSFVVRCLAYLAWFAINLILISVPIVLITSIFKRYSMKKV